MRRRSTLNKVLRLPLVTWQHWRGGLSLRLALLAASLTVTDLFFREKRREPANK